MADTDEWDKFMGEGNLSILQFFKSNFGHFNHQLHSMLKKSLLNATKTPPLYIIYVLKLKKLGTIMTIAPGILAQEKG